MVLNAAASSGASPRGRFGTDRGEPGSLHGSAPAWQSRRAVRNPRTASCRASVTRSDQRIRRTDRRSCRRPAPRRTRECG
ncbi:TPA: hypothetical protein QDE31_04810 [Burkholderia cenocepacia]|nr:hypothetical protein [Burkholderia cenocepacia]